MKIIKNFLIITVVLFTMSAQVVLAQGLKSAGGKLEGLSSQGVTLTSDTEGLTNTIIKTIFYLVGTIFLILMVYGGFVWLKASGKEDDINKAKKIITTSIIGMVIILASYAITNFALSRVGQ